MSKLACMALAATLLIAGRPAAGQDATEPLAAGLEPTDTKYLYEVMRHLYRWYLDESDVMSGIKQGRFLFWVRELRPELDEGDKSRFVEIVLPDIGLYVQVKRADYHIEELKVKVRSDRFRITHVRRDEPATEKPSDAKVIEVEYAAMRDYMFRTRNRIKPPDDRLLERLRAAARQHTLKYLEERGLEPPKDSLTIHLGPISPVANEAWVYWEQGRVLFRFSADIALEEPAFWEHEKLAVELYSIDEQVVVTLDEVAGSNAYLTRDHVGRVLFNCMVFGRRVELTAAKE